MTTQRIGIEFYADVARYLSGVQAMDHKTKRMTRTIQGWGRQMKMAGLAGAAGLGLAAKAAGDFEQSIANMNSVAQATQGELKQLRGLALDIGKTTPSSAKAAADAMYWLASAGQRANEIMSTLPGVTTLASATQFDLAETTETVVATLKSFRMEAGETDRIVNVFAATIGNTMANMQKLSESIKYVGPMASAAGMSIEETSAALGTLYNAGLQGSQAGTTLRRILGGLLKPTEALTARLRAVGLSAEDVDPRMHSLAEIMETLKQAGFDAKSAIEDFGLRGSSGIISLVNAGAGLSALTDKITGTQRASEMMATQMDTFNGQMKLLKNNIIALGIEFGTTMLPMLRDFVEDAKSAIQGLSSVADATKFLTVKLVALSAGLLLVLGRVAALAPILGAATGPIGLFIIGIAAVAAGITALNSKVERHFELIAKAASAHSEATEKVGALAKRYRELTETIGPLTKDQMAELKSVTVDMIRLVPELNGLTVRQAQGYEDLAAAAEKYADAQRDIAVGEAQVALSRRAALATRLEHPDPLMGTSGVESALARVDALIAGISDEILALASGLDFIDVPDDLDVEHWEGRKEKITEVVEAVNGIAEAFDVVEASVRSASDAMAVFGSGDTDKPDPLSIEFDITEIANLIDLFGDWNMAIDVLGQNFTDWFGDVLPQVLNNFVSGIRSAMNHVVEIEGQWLKSLGTAMASGLITMFQMYIDFLAAELLATQITENGKVVMKAFTNPKVLLKIALIGAAYGAATAALQSIQPYEKGGGVDRTGEAILHAGEYVATADDVRSALVGAGGGGGVNITVNFEGGAGGLNIGDVEDTMRRTAELFRRAKVR